MELIQARFIGVELIVGLHSPPDIASPSVVFDDAEIANLGTGCQTRCNALRAELPRSRLTTQSVFLANWVFSQ
jgi:hypothetical protein